MYTLYFAPGSCALATHIALAESGLPYAVRRVDTKGGEQRSEAYLKINPKGRVPALVTENGALTETVALLSYIAQLAPAKKLAPLDDPFQLARMQGFNTYLASTVHVNHAHGPRGSRWADEASSLADMLNKVPQTMRDCFTLIEKDFLEGPWVLGENYSVADGYLMTMARWLATDKIDIADFPKVAAHYERMLARPAVQKALEEEKAA